MKKCNDILIRITDIIISLLSLIILSPFFILIILILKNTGEKEIFFSQTRVGKHKKKIKLIKFATMIKNSPYIYSKNITVYNDKRILPFGKILRKYKINELPQLLNILNGDLSLVGPRPLTEDNFNKYNIKNQLIITKFKPGLTGVGTIFFSKEEEIKISDPIKKVKFYKNKISPFKEKLEIWYSKNYNFKNYILIILLTFILIFFRKNFLYKVYKDLPKIPNDLKFLIK